MKLVPPALLAVLLSFLQWRSGIAGSYPIVLGVMMVFAYVVMAGGRLMLVAVGESESNTSATYASGLLGTCLALYAVSLIYPFTAAQAFGLLGVVVVVLDVINRRRAAAAPDRGELIGFALCVAFTAAWSSGPAGAYEVLRMQNVLPVWGDYFVHGARISHFGDVRAIGRGSIFFSDYPSSFYHFASYFSAAPLAGMLERPGLALATSAWMPLGFLAMATGAHALGERLAGAAGGIAAVAAVAILPDASNYGLRNGFLSFQWSVFAHPGAMYALGAAFLSLSLLERWSRDRSTAALIASAAIAASVLFFRAHVFLLYAPAWLATALYCAAQGLPRKRRVSLLLAGGLAAGAGLMNLALTYLAQTHPSLQWRFGGPALTRFLEVTHSGMGPTAYMGWYAYLVSWYPWWLSLSVGIVLAYLAALGGFVLALPAVAFLARRRTLLRPIDALPAYLAYSWFLLMLFAPLTWAVHGPELIDRPVVLLYACSVIWTFCVLLRWLSLRIEQPHRAWRALLIASLLALPAIAVNAERMTRPKFTSGEPYIALRVPPGLIQAADYLRSHARVGDVFAAAGLNEDLAVVDLPTMICALTGLPTYLARPHLEMIKDAPRKAQAAARLAALQEVARQTSARAAAALLRALSVQWYVVAGEHGPLWDPQRRRADFTAGAISLYAVERM